MRLYNYTIVLLLLPLITAAQGKIDGFYNAPTTITTVLGFGFEDSKKYLAGDNKLDLERNVYYATFFASYTISEKLQTQFSLPYIRSNNNKNLQDISVFLKYQLFEIPLAENRLKFSLAGGFSTPVSNYSIGGLNDIGQQATVIESRAMVHYKHNTGWFGTLQSGFSYKLQEVPNSLPITLKVGRASAQWYYDLYYDFQRAFGGIDYRGTPSPQNFRELGVDFHKVGGTLYKPLSSTLGAYVTVAYIVEGRNTFVGASYGIGLRYQTNFK